jgi:nucleoside-diphosphate-sugar epimerase
LFSKFDNDLFLNFFNNSFKKLKNKIFFITGATGFVGTWILGALLFANDNFSLNIKIYILSRNPKLFQSSNIYIANHPSVVFIKGDIRKTLNTKTLSQLPDQFDYFIHAACDLSSKISPLDMFEICTLGTKKILDLAKLIKVKEFLLISSGAVYGSQPDNINALSECYLGNLNWKDGDSFAYGLGKINSEWITKEYSNKKYFKTKIARCFAFVGPYMKMDKNFAIGNFIKDAAEGKNIKVKGDGRPIRTYLYAGELSIWLLEILINSKENSIYNVGGSEEISIFNLAKKIANLINPKLSVIVSNSNTFANKSNKYIPDINLIKKELNLTPKIDLEQSIIQTYEWYVSSKC